MFFRRAILIIFCIGSVISSLAIAESRDATIGDIALLVGKLPPGIYTSRRAPGTQVCSVNVRADDTHYRVVIEPITSSAGLRKKALFAALVGAPLACDLEKGKITGGLFYCTAFTNESLILAQLTINLNSDGSLKVATSFSDSDGSASAQCNIRTK